MSYQVISSTTMADLAAQASALCAIGCTVKVNSTYLQIFCPVNSSQVLASTTNTSGKYSAIVYYGENYFYVQASITSKVVGYSKINNNAYYEYSTNGSACLVTATERVSLGNSYAYSLNPPCKDTFAAIAPLVTTGYGGVLEYGTKVNNHYVQSGLNTGNGNTYNIGGKTYLYAYFLICIS